MRDLRHTPIRLGLLGCGSFAQRRILTALAETTTIKAVCIQKRDLAEAKAIAEKFGIPSAVNTREDLLRHPEVEAVFVATPNHRHAEDAVACAEAGKPTLCEKPLAPTVAEIEQMMAAFKTHSVPLLVGQSLRFKPCVEKAKEILKRGALGELQSIHAYFTILVPKENWRHRKAYGGGVLQDIGVHLIDLIQNIAEEKIVSVQANGQLDDTDETVSAVCELASGVPVSFECSFEKDYSSGFEVLGTKRGIESMNSLRQTMEPGETLFLIREDGSRIELPMKPGNIYVEELKHFADVLNGTATCKIPASIGLQNQRVIEAAYRSILLRKETPV